MIKILEFDVIHVYEDLRARVWNDGKKYPYRYQLTGSPMNHYVWPSVERAIIEAIAAKYQGEQGAGGTGVDTAAGWFARMIGMES